MNRDDGYVLIGRGYLHALEELHEACEATKVGGAYVLPPQIAITLEHVIKVATKQKWSPDPRNRIEAIGATVLTEVKSVFTSEEYLCPGGHRADGQPVEEIVYDDVKYTRYDPNAEAGYIEPGKCNRPITITWEDESEDGYHRYSYPVASSEDYFMSDKEYEEAKKSKTFFQHGSCVRALGLDDAEPFWPSPWLDFYARGYAMGIITTAENRNRVRLEQASRGGNSL